MAKRVTVMLDDDLVKKLRHKQANVIKDSVKSVSFSKVINQQIQRALK